MSDSMFSPNRIIPRGSQVVLRTDRAVVNSPEAFKKLGSVGVVSESPISNDQPYEIRFRDGATVTAMRAELTVRRADAPEADLPARSFLDYEPFLIYRVRSGSHAYGLTDEKSDVDERGIFVPPADWHWSLEAVPDQVEFKRKPDGTIVDHQTPGESDDFCWWEVEKFVRLALKANPNILEVLYVPEREILHVDALGQRLREIRSAFLSKYVFQTYSGYVLSQFRRMKRELKHGREFRPKHAMHLIRLLLAGISALETGEIKVDVSEHAEELLQIKRGEKAFDEISARAEQLETHFERAAANTTLPDRPDVDTVNSFLIDARRSRI